ncbi:SDR family oxidoreductase [Streptomyces sp. NPDC059629]|uniref:SDR family oxidoreductase n=1 Tax=Streptomyces sp. NPDC059629 TaxID=3346889 RepID=UPI0036869FB7
MTRKQVSGRLVHIGSRSGFEGEPGVSLYSASKFAVAGIGEALSAEMAPFGIQSMVVEPGVWRTDFLDASSLSVAQNRISDYDDHDIDVLQSADIAETVAFVAAVPRRVNLTEITILPTARAI